jgi:hypothetical protein
MQLDFKSQPFLKVYPPICSITAPEPTPGRKSFPQFLFYAFTQMNGAWI